MEAIDIFKIIDFIIIILEWAACQTNKSTGCRVLPQMASFSCMKQVKIQKCTSTSDMSNKMTQQWKQKASQRFSRIMKPKSEMTICK